MHLSLAACIDGKGMLVKVYRSFIGHILRNEAKIATYTDGFSAIHATFYLVSMYVHKMDDLYGRDTHTGAHLPCKGFNQTLRTRPY